MMPPAPDLVAFGRPFIPNPMLVSKLRRNAELVVADSATFYTPGEAGQGERALCFIMLVG